MRDLQRAQKRNSYLSFGHLDVARIIGCEDRIGSLMSGKDADILTLGGYPFHKGPIAAIVIIDGKMTYRREIGETCR